MDILEDVRRQIKVCMSCGITLRDILSEVYPPEIRSFITSEFNRLQPSVNPEDYIKKLQ